MDPALITSALAASQSSGSGLDGLILTLLVVVVGGLAKQIVDGHKRDKREQNGHAPATKEDVQDHVRNLMDRIDKHAEASQRRDAEINDRIDRVETAAKEDRKRIGEAEGDIKVLNDRSKSGRCNSASND